VKWRNYTKAPEILHEISMLFWYNGLDSIERVPACICRIREGMMQRSWKLMGVATIVVVLGVALLGIAAYAQDEEGSPFDFGTRFREAIAAALGITVDEYDAVVKQAHEQVIDEAVTEGRLTEEQAERMRERMDQAPDTWGWGKGFRGPKGHGAWGEDDGFRAPRSGFWGRGAVSPIGVAAEELGVTAADLMAEIQAGKSIADVAGEKGVDVQAIVDAYLAQLGEVLDQAVQNGRITQDQADSMLEHAQETVPEMLENPWQGRGPSRFPGGSPGRMGYPGTSDA
jgi:polyhydroxyalkanoate synthesis regulator phasin